MKTKGHIFIILFLALMFPMNAQAINYSVPITSYQLFRDTVIGNGYNIDGYYGYQCWDGAGLLWQQLGMRLNTAHSYYGGSYSSGARSCWEYEAVRNANAGSQFDLIWDKTKILRGDVLVFGGSTYGHIGFADESYWDGMTSIKVLGQNQTNPNDTTGHVFDVKSFPLNTFLGAFRYKRWGYANLGDDFYAVILNTENWMPISEIDGSDNIYLQKETGSPKQTWRFTRQSDGAYVIKSCNDGKVLEMTDPDNRKNNNPIYAITDNFWGGYYQQWYLIPQGNGYIFLSKHFQNEEWAMDYNSKNNAIQIYKRNNSKYQIWSVYKGNDSQLHGPTLKVATGNSLSPTKFTWNDVYGEKGFNLKIWCGTIADYKKSYSAVSDASSGYSTTLPAGSYYAYIDAYDYFHWAQGNIVFFNVPVGYSVSYNANGGSCSTTSKTVTAGSSVALPTPTRSGFTFSGWYTAASGGSKVGSAGGTYTPTKSLTLYAQWNANSYTVTLNDSNGNVSPTSISVTYGGTYSNLPTNPTRTGYTFAGWYTDSGSLVTTSTKVTATSNHTLTARWNAVLVSTVQLNKTKLDLMIFADWIGTINSTSETLTATATPSNAANKAVTWSSSNTGVATVDANGKVTAVAVGTATITAAAKDGSGVKGTCAVTVSQWYQLDLNGLLDGTIGTGNIDKYGTVDVYVNGKLVGDDVSDYCTPWPKGTTYEIKDIKVKSGYAYNGVTMEALKGTVGEKRLDIRLSFSTIDKYIVTLNPNGGSVSPTSVKATYVQPCKNLPEPTRTGYTFAGWYLDNTKVTTSTTVTATSDHTLYAQWTAIPVSGVKLDKTTVDMKTRDIFTLTATVAPSDALDKTVTWSSSNTGVATVDGGIVTAVGAGTATITAKVGDKTATCVVTVSERQCQITQLTPIDAGGQPLAVIPRGVFHVRAAVRKPTDEDVNVILACYAEDGRFAGFSSQTVAGAAGESIEVTLPVDNSDGSVAHLKAFCVFPDTIDPLSEARDCFAP